MFFHFGQINILIEISVIYVQKNKKGEAYV